MDTATIGAVIRQVRRRQNLKQPDLALLANVGVRFLVDLENGKETCQIGLTLKVLKALGISLELRMPAHDHPTSDELSFDFDENSDGFEP